MTNVFDVLALLLGLAALLGLINYGLLRLPDTVGLLIGALGLALLLFVIDRAAPQLGLRTLLRTFVDQVNMPSTLLNGLLGFLLFAAAMELDFADLLERKWTILALALGGTVLSTLLVGAGTSALSQALGLGLPAVWCFTFGALISPTDPIAVHDVLRRVGIPRTMRATVAGESLFNDGVGVVLFTVVAGVATHAIDRPTSFGLLRLFLVEAVGGGLFGLLTGWIAFSIMRRVDDRNLELIISLALVTLTYSAANRIGVSGPLAVIVAGILIGNHGVRLAMSERTREHLQKFWSLVDELLNALLFLLIGLEVASLPLAPHALVFGAVAIPLCLAARGISVAATALPLHLRAAHRLGGLTILTWGGVRGALSVALALSLPRGPETSLLVSGCYVVVIFTLTVQGLTLGRVAARLFPAAAPE